MSHTMSKTRMAVGSGAALLAMLVLPAGHSEAAQGEDVDISTCLAPLGGTPRSPDVLQGWIDGCRREQAIYADEDVDISVCLATLGDSRRSPDVLQGRIDGCRREQVNHAAGSLRNSP